MPMSETPRTPHSEASDWPPLGMGQSPSPVARISPSGWGQVLRRCFSRVFEDRLLGEAAAIAFYALLAVFPALAALVSLCGLLIDPARAAERFQGLAGMLPAGSADMVGQVVGRTAAHGGGRLGLGIGLAAAALWSATAASMQLFGALNLAYGEVESRRLMRLTWTALVFALGAMAFVALALGGVLAVPAALGARAGTGGSMDQLLHVLRWPVLLAAVSIALALAYRHGPSRICPRWNWVSPGGVVAAVAWLLGSAAVSWYIEHVSSFDWLYGSAGAVLGFMIWAWVSCVAVLIGAVLNAEIERQTTISVPIIVSP
jgi:membrane protein